MPPSSPPGPCLSLPPFPLCFPWFPLASFLAPLAPLSLIPSPSLGPSLGPSRPFSLTLLPLPLVPPLSSPPPSLPISCCHYAYLLYAHCLIPPHSYSIIRLLHRHITSQRICPPSHDALNADFVTRIPQQYPAAIPTSSRRDRHHFEATTEVTTERPSHSKRTWSCMAWKHPIGVWTSKTQAVGIAYNTTWRIRSEGARPATTMVRLFMQQDQRRRLCEPRKSSTLAFRPTHAIAPNTNRRSALAYWQRPTKTSHNS